MAPESSFMGFGRNVLLGTMFVVLTATLAPTQFEMVARAGRPVATSATVDFLSRTVTMAAAGMAVGSFLSLFARNIGDWMLSLTGSNKAQRVRLDNTLRAGLEGTASYPTVVMAKTPQERIRRYSLHASSRTETKDLAAGAVQDLRSAQSFVLAGILFIMVALILLGLNAMARHMDRVLVGAAMAASGVVFLWAARRDHRSSLERLDTCFQSDPYLAGERAAQRKARDDAEEKARAEDDRVNAAHAQVAKAEKALLAVVAKAEQALVMAAEAQRGAEERAAQEHEKAERAEAALKQREGEAMKWLLEASTKMRAEDDEQRKVGLASLAEELRRSRPLDDNAYWDALEQALETVARLSEEDRKPVLVALRTYLEHVTDEVRGGALMRQMSKILLNQLATAPRESPSIKPLVGVLAFAEDKETAEALLDFLERWVVEDRAGMNAVDNSGIVPAIADSHLCDRNRSHIEGLVRTKFGQSTSVAVREVGAKLSAALERRDQYSSARPNKPGWMVRTIV